MSETGAQKRSPGATLADVAGLPAELARFIGFLLGKAYDAEIAETERALAQLGLRARAFGLLVLLVEAPRSQAELGRAMRIDRTTMVKLVDDLERLGYAERASNPHHRRTNAVTLTVAGRRAVARGRRLHAAAEGEFLDVLSPDEQATLRSLLLRLIESSDARSP